MAGCGTSASAAPPVAPGPSPAGTAAEEVAVVAVGGCPAFAVTNRSGQAMTYTITYAWSPDGASAASSQQAVVAVGPGQTVRRAVEPRVRPAADTRAERVRLTKVRSVPTAELPSASGACPASGVRVYADRGDAAMGLRVVGLHLVNCGTGVYRLDGYPAVRVLDERHDVVGAVRVLHGGDAVATGTGADGPARPVTLAPGQSARSALVWRNTTGQGSDPVNAPYARVVARPGAPAVMVTPELDLGTTGKLAVGPWKADNSPTPPRG